MAPPPVWMYRRILDVMRDAPTPTAMLPTVDRLTSRLGISREDLTEVQALVWASAHGTHPHAVQEQVEQVGHVLHTSAQWFWRVAVGYGLLVMSLGTVGALLRVSTDPTRVTLVSAVLLLLITTSMVLVLRSDLVLAVRGVPTWGWGTVLHSDMGKRHAIMPPVYCSCSSVLNRSSKTTNHATSNTNWTNSWNGLPSMFR